MAIEKIMLVTGANRGIGLATVKGLAERGHRVLLTARSAMSGQSAWQQIGRPDTVTTHVLDVTDESSCQAMVQYVKREHGRLDGLINNAGINYDTYHHVLNANLSDVRNTLETNLLAPWRMVKLFLPLLQKAVSASVVNVSSGSGAWASQNGQTPGYSLSKLGLNALTKAMAQQLSGDRVRVNAVCPGWVRTDMGGQGAPRSPEEGADTIIWAALLDDPAMTGKFFRDRREIVW